MDFREKTYEGVGALSALTMAVFERCGLRDVIAEALGPAGAGRDLPVPSVVKMAVGAMTAPFDRIALSRFGEFYASAPVDMLFGEGLTKDSLNGTSVARALDVLYGAADLEELSWRCSERCCEVYGLSSDIYHLDATNVPVYAVVEYLPDGGAPSAQFGGNSKTNRNDLRQYDAMAVADGNRVLRYLRTYSGNTGDAEMDADALEFLRTHIDTERSVCVADCKIVSKALVEGMCAMGLGFVSRCPEGFSEKVRETIVRSVGSSYLEESSLGEGYGTYDTDADTVCGPLRFIAYRTPKDREREVAYYREQGERLLSRAFSKPLRTEYHCREDAEAAAEAAAASVGDMGYRVRYAVSEGGRPVRRASRGRPPKGSPPPETETFWTLEVSWEFDEAAASALAEGEEIQVLVTNLPRANEDAGNIRFGATADTVVRTYLDEYKPEHVFRLLKSGIGMDKVYLHRGSRVAAMFFIAGVAGTLLSVMDEMLRRGNADMTTYRMRLGLHDTTVRVKRTTGYTYIDGHPGAGAEIESYCRIFGLEPELMLGM